MYCNQTWLPRRLTLEDWNGLLEEAADPIPPYVYLTGGEPLLTASEIWGDGGLVAHATDLGCAVNVNTNAVLVTPHVALQLVKVGLSKLHVSIDAADPDVQGQLFESPDRLPAVLRGLHAIQVAREALGTHHPEIHVNCVLTARNMFRFPDLLRFLLETRRAPRPGALDDFAFHLIPVGGEENIFLRPTAEEWKRFHTETWDEAERVWQEHQEETGVPAGERRPLEEAVPFASPYRRARHELTLDEYCEQAADGEYWQGALTDRCYVSPTQAFVLPDGSQHWCGAHAIGRPDPIGDVRTRSLRENIRAAMDDWGELPDERCHGCAGATCAINQAARRNLRAQISDWLADPGPGPSA
jgi:MoaA/NifB/PqqE/SkfB family radical SAM enzyme